MGEEPEIVLKVDSVVSPATPFPGDHRALLISCYRGECIQWLLLAPSLVTEGYMYHPCHATLLKVRGPTSAHALRFPTVSHSLIISKFLHLCFQTQSACPWTWEGLPSPVLLWKGVPVLTLRMAPWALHVTHIPFTNPENHLSDARLNNTQHLHRLKFQCVCYFKIWSFCPLVLIEYLDTGRVVIRSLIKVVW